MPYLDRHGRGRTQFYVATGKRLFPSAACARIAIAIVSCCTSVLPAGDTSKRYVSETIQITRHVSRLSDKKTLIPKGERETYSEFSASYRSGLERGKILR